MIDFRFSAAFATVLFAFGALFELMTSPANAQSILLGRHTVSLRLRPMPAADVLRLLSGRSKAVNRMAVPHTDEGRPWRVDGAELLDGLVIAVHFVETPVEEQVTVILGCLGFAYQEQGDRIQIVKAPQTLSPDRCASVKLVSPGTSDSMPQKKLDNIWKFDSISGLDFIKRYTYDTQNIVKVPDAYLSALSQVMVSVDVVNMPDGEVMSNLANCIGWTLHSSSEGYVLSKPESVSPRTPCSGFAIHENE